MTIFRNDYQKTIEQLLNLYKLEKKITFVVLNYLKI